MKKLYTFNFFKEFPLWSHEVQKPYSHPRQPNVHSLASSEALKVLMEVNMHQSVVQTYFDDPLLHAVPFPFLIVANL